MKLLQGQTVGIDLGTTYSAVSQLNEAGEPMALKSAAGQKTTPSIVLFGEQGKVLVGPSLERLAQCGEPRRRDIRRREEGAAELLRREQELENLAILRRLGEICDEGDVRNL